LYSIEEGEFLVKLARDSVSYYLKEGKKPSPPAPPSRRMVEKSGVFVTITKLVNGERTLRGCIGYPLPYLPLIEATVDSAVSAAVNDPRFPPMKERELNEVLFEVSILSAPELISVRETKDYPKMIKVGRDGLVVEKGYYKGLLLPQVPVEYGWDAETFLAECCMKAGLPPDAWLSKSTKIYSFTAEVFSEEPDGRVVKKALE